MVVPSIARHGLTRRALLGLVSASVVRLHAQAPKAGTRVDFACQNAFGQRGSEIAADVEFVLFALPPSQLEFYDEPSAILRDGEPNVVRSADFPAGSAHLVYRWKSERREGPPTSEYARVFTVKEVSGVRRLVVQGDVVEVTRADGGIEKVNASTFRAGRFFQEKTYGFDGAFHRMDRYERTFERAVSVANALLPAQHRLSAERARPWDARVRIFAALSPSATGPDDIDRPLVDAGLRQVYLLADRIVESARPAVDAWFSHTHASLLLNLRSALRPESWDALTAAQRTRYALPTEFLAGHSYKSVVWYRPADPTEPTSIDPDGFFIGRVAAHDGTTFRPLLFTNSRALG
jgi:hypothetical protein